MPSSKPASVFTGLALCGCALPSADIQAPEPGSGSGSGDATEGGKARKRKDRRRPQLVEARQLTPTQLRVQLSEPLASVEGVDPR